MSQPETPRKIYGWYSPKQATYVGVSIYEDMDGKEVRVTEVNTIPEKYGRWDDYQPLGELKRFIREGDQSVSPNHQVEQLHLTDPQFRSLLDLFMCSDPWPVHRNTGDGRKTIESLLDTEAKARGYADWIGAYHEFRLKLGEKTPFKGPYPPIDKEISQEAIDLTKSILRRK